MNSPLFIPLLKVGLVFAFMLAGIRYKLGIGPSILAGSLVLGLIFGLGPVDWLITAFSALADTQFLLLLIIIEAIMILSHLLETSGQSQRIMHTLSRHLRWPRLRLAFFPALIGLLPMPGGAVFSAPMVKSASQDFSLSSMDQTLLNYWFRHLWELIWPMYPGIILAASLSNTSLLHFIGLTWPSFPVCILLGWIFFLRPHKTPLAPESERSAFSSSQEDSWKQTLPLILAVGGTLVLQGLIWVTALPLPSELGFILALICAIWICLGQNDISGHRVWPLLIKKHFVQMLFTLLAIFVFKDVLDQGGVVGELAQSTGSASALILICILLPLIVGLISGLTLAYVGATFPLIVGILDHLGLENRISYLVLAMFAGYAGVLGSPLHICFLLTCEFFNVNPFSAWLRILPPSILFLATGCLYFWILAL
ncbi:MAG: DUF401 family protein [Thermodesulfobacteriota bacterium]